MLLLILDKALEVIDGYNKIYPLEDEEYNLLYILLLFPRDFCGIVNLIITSKKTGKRKFL